jgi:hypothetical protein
MEDGQIWNKDVHEASDPVQENSECYGGTKGEIVQISELNEPNG